MLELIGLGGVFCIGLGALCVPLDVSLSFDTASTEKLNLRLTWLFGFLRVHLPKSGKRPAKPKGKRKKKAGGVRKRDLRLAFRILQVKGMGHAIARLVRRILLRLEVRDLRGEVTIGLDDPADTGVLMGVLIPACITLNALTREFFVIVPSFEGAVFEGNGKIIVRLFPIRLCLSAVRFVFSIPVFTALKIVIEARWKEKR